MNLLATFAPIALVSSLQAQMVHVVDSDGGGDFLEISAAVAAASSGDTILVRGESAFAGFDLDGKGLNLLGDSTDGFVNVLTNTTISNIPTGESVLIDGFHFDGAGVPGSSEPNLRLLDCQGTVSLQDCFFDGRQLNILSFVANYHGLVVDNCDSVSITESRLEGAQSPSYTNPGFPSGAGLVATDSSIFIYDSEIVGGRATKTVNSPTGLNFEFAAGGYGVLAEGSFVLMEGTPIHGGPGGFDNHPVFCKDGSDGGAAIRSVNSSVLYRDSSPTAGEGGSSFAPCIPGVAGQAIEFVGTAPTGLAGNAKSYRLEPNPIREFQPGVVTRVGDPGDQVWIMISFRANALYFPALSGAVLLDAPITLLPSLSISAAGSNSFPVSFGDLGPGLDSLAFGAQILTFNAGKAFDWDRANGSRSSTAASSRRLRASCSKEPSPRVPIQGARGLFWCLSFGRHK